MNVQAAWSFSYMRLVFEQCAIGSVHLERRREAGRLCAVEGCLVFARHERMGVRAPINPSHPE